jgi:lipid-binding SYLF domain-containing protein
MRFQLTLAAACLAALVCTTPAAAETREERRVSDAAAVLDQFLRIPEESIPPSLLARAYAVAVVPNNIAAAFGVGARHGKGILVVRQEDASWSNPAFIALTGGSFGFQAGAQSTDIILVFKTRSVVESIANGKVTLGANASIAAGPVGRSTHAATDIAFKAEVLSYSRSRGLFAGIALEGSGVTMDRKANAAFYGDASMTPEAIFASSPNIAPDVANSFVQLLTAQTVRLPSAPGMQASGQRTPATESETGESSVRTFGLPDPDESEEGEL